jgi:hypothetical protein
MINNISTIDSAPDASTPLPLCQPHQVSPIHFSLPAEEDVLGLEEDLLGFQTTDFPPGSLSSECAGTLLSRAVVPLDLDEDARISAFMAELPPPLSVQDSSIHIVGCPRVYGIFGDKTRVYSYTHTATPPHTGLCDSGANLCMTNNPHLLVDVRPCKPFSISLATSDGSNSHTNVCSRRGLLPIPLTDGTVYYQTCIINPYASETFISPQAIIDSSAGSFDKWQMKGFSQGRPGVLSLYSPSGILKMFIQLTQNDGLYYSPTDTFTVDTDPRSRSSPFIGIAFTDLPPDTHLIDDDDNTACSADSDDDSVPAIPIFTTPTTAVSTPHSTAPLPQRINPIDDPVDPTPHGAPTRSRVTVRLTNLARQLESKLWAARMGHCGEDQLLSLATRADGLPNHFVFHPFRYIDWKEQARVRKRAALCIAEKVHDAGARFYMDFGFIRASSVNYRRPNITSDRVIDSYDGYSSYLLIVDDKSAMSWIFLTKTKHPPMEHVRLFLCTFGRTRSLGGFIRCDQGGELARSHAFIDMALTEFGYKVEPTGADSPSQNGQAEKWNDVFAVTTRALLYGAALEPKYWSAALLHASYLHNRRVHSRTGITPFEGWWGTKPNLKYLKLFGARVCVKQTGPRRSKLDKHDFPGLFLGYTSTDQNIRYLDLNSGITKSCHHATFDKAWYLQDDRPPAAQLLYQLGLEDDPDFSTCPPDGPFKVAPYPPSSPLFPPDTSTAWMHNLPLRLSPAPHNATLHSITSRSPHAGTCIAPLDDTTTSLSYGVSANDVAQIYLSPTPYNDAFEEELDLRKFYFKLHHTAGMSFIPQDTRLILASMVPSTPGARIPRWRTRLRGAWLLLVNGTPVDSIVSVQQAFNSLSLSRASSCILLFAHPEISHGISNKGLPLLRRDQFTQQNINQLSNRWTPKPTIPPDLPKAPNWDIVIDSDVRNVVTKAMKLTRGELMNRTTGPTGTSLNTFNSTNTTNNSCLATQLLQETTQQSSTLSGHAS